MHSASLLTLAWMLTDFALHLEDYNANRALMLRSGFVGLVWLAASFACTPISRWARWPQAVRIRRALGLYGFLFVAIHLGVYLWLDNDFDLTLVLRDLEERRAMAIGLMGFALLVPLALTSTKGWQRRLGQGWSRLHKLAYLALPLSVWHYLWLDRDFIAVPLIFAVLVGGLLLARLRIARSA
jgi:methionine sulfoxide reductase heme-binding subunit